MHDTTSNSNSTDRDPNGNPNGNPYGIPYGNPTKSPPINPAPVNPELVQQAPPDQTPSHQTYPSVSASGVAPASHTATSQASENQALDKEAFDKEALKDREYLQQLGPLRDPLLVKLEKTMAPIEMIFGQMAGIVQSHLEQHATIDDLQDIMRECDQVLQYSKHIGRQMKFHQDLRVNRDKLDRAQHFL